LIERAAGAEALRQTDALSRYSEFTYDAVGNLSTKTDPLGNTTTFTYDALNRLVQKEYEDDSYVAYEFDASGNMTEASDGTITFEFTYDAENKPTKVRDDTQGLEIEYSYDDNGNLLWIEDTSNSKSNYYYDALNRVTDITNGSTFATIEYATCCSIRAKLTLGNGCYTEYEYDDAKRLTKITNKKSNGTVISSWDYAYDDVGNVTSQTDKDSLATSYTYDDIYRLTHVNYPSGSDYGYDYDAVGNRTKMSEYTTSTITTTYTYDNADELTQYTTSTLTMSFGYASDGCLVSKSDGSDTWTYDWDYERRLAGFKKNGATLVEYAYNPTGMRRYSSDSTLGLTNYFWSGGHVLADYSSNWSLTRSYIFGPRVDEMIAMIDRTTDPNVTHYFTRDRLGSTRELVNASETLMTRYDYDAWGSPTETQLSGSVSSRYRFTGRSLDPTSGLYNYRARHYDDGLGRFTSRDPLYRGCRSRIDRYVYVGNNPATMVDPLGLTGVAWVPSGMTASYGSQDGDPDGDSCETACNKCCSSIGCATLGMKCGCDCRSSGEGSCTCRCGCEDYHVASEDPESSQVQPRDARYEVGVWGRWDQRRAVSQLVSPGAWIYGS